jgi:hypothetical protein
MGISPRLVTAGCNSSALARARRAKSRKGSRSASRAWKELREDSGQARPVFHHFITLRAEEFDNLFYCGADDSCEGGQGDRGNNKDSHMWGIALLGADRYRQQGSGYPRGAAQRETVLCHPWAVSRPSARLEPVQ